MPGLVRRASSLDDEEDAGRSEGVSEGSDDGTPLPRNPNKRVRLRDEAEVDDSWMLSPPGTVRRELDGRRGRSLRASTVASAGATSTVSSAAAAAEPVEFKPGQLLRIHLRNFITYTDATFYPGPSLNMIIGPNGTGKSSVVCAICIGLGFSTTHLGRAKELHEFVKHDSKQASIEIEIKGFPGKTNKTIRLDFQKDGEKKQWSLDGQPCRAKDIHQLVAKFGIQCDNLCHFLPQDRVVEFSRLNAKDRLSSTLRAAASPEVIEYHEQLKALATDRRKVHTEQEEKQQQLKQLEKRQESQRGDVQRMRERAELIDKLTKLRKLYPLAKHMEARAAFEEAKAKRQALDQDLEHLNSLVQPYDDAVKRQKEYFDDMAETSKSRMRLCDNLETLVNKCAQDKEKIATEIQHVERKREARKKDLSSRKKQIADLQGKISNVEAQIEQRPIEIDAAEYNRKINYKTRDIRTLQQQITDIKDGASERVGQVQDKKRQVQQRKEELDNLHSQSGQMRNKLAQLSPDTLKAWDWIQQNQHRFKKPVYGPPLLTCSIKDPRYAPLVESLFGVKDICRITCTDFEDWKFLQKHLSEQMQLSDVALFNSKTKLEEFARQFDEDQMHRLGLEAWAIDFLEGPDDVLSMLCDYSRIHTTGVVWRDDSSTEQFSRLENSGLSSWVTSKNAYRVTRRQEYSAKSTRSAPVPERARFWSNQGVDVNAESNLKRQIAELEDEIQQHQGTQDTTRQRIEELGQSIKTLEDEKASLLKEKEDKQRHNSMLAALPNKLSGFQNKLKEAQEAEIECRGSFDELRGQRETVVMKAGQLEINYTNLVDQLRLKFAEYTSSRIAVVEAESSHEQCKKQYLDATRDRDRKRGEREEVNKQVREHNKKAKDHVKEWIEATNQDPSLNEYYQTLTQDERSRTPSQLKTETEAVQAQVQMLEGGNPHMIKEFESRAEKISKLGDDVRTSSEKVKELYQQIMTIRGDFEPAVDALADKISQIFGDLFARINCAGSVQVFKPGAATGPDHEPEDNVNNASNANGDPSPHALTLEEGHDYENWQIHILVKFRENEALSVLDSHRQSGGERAVTTIYYLMSLQRLSRAPFRVVDEINQGMDPRNERIVHERMVDMSCGADDEVDDEEAVAARSQYFLITPKLLPNLKYAKGMKVHCIASGEFMPPAPKKNVPNAPTLDFRLLIGKERARLARERGSVVGGIEA